MGPSMHPPEHVLGGSQQPLSLGGAAGTQLAGTLQSTLLHNQQMSFNFSLTATRESRLWSRVCKTPVLSLIRDSLKGVPVPPPLAHLPAQEVLFSSHKVRSANMARWFKHPYHVTKVKS